jgi:acetolactate synthase-1/2/3 large subunit
MLVVMLNSRAFLNSLNHQIYMAKERGDPVKKGSLGTTIDHPAPDFAKLAQSFGWYAESNRG